MRIIAGMKAGLWLAGLMGLLAGCATPLPQLTYRGMLPAPMTDPFGVAGEFATELATTADLQITDRTSPSGNARIDASAFVELRTKTAPLVRVTIAAYAADRLVVTTIAGAYTSPRAAEIGRASQAAFARLHPDARYESFEAKGGLFGP